MRMPEPEEDKVTATGGGLRARTLRFCEHLSENFFTVKCAKTFQRVSLADLYM